jgi:DNA-directed RNA polymerase specialized sigma24 family protein
MSDRLVSSIEKQTSPLTKKSWNQEAFNKLLAWLDPDRDKAGEKYSQIQFRLIKIFACKGCSEPEDLADETLDVVIRKIDWLTENYEGDPALYFFGVAKKKHLEQLKRKPPPNPPLPEPPPPDEIDCASECLDNCLKRLNAEDRNLVLQYHEESKGAKIRLRKQLAQELGVSINALRIRIFHLHSDLRQCIDLCMRNVFPA